MPDLAVRMQGVVKRYGETTALDGVEFELRRGEIHALLGENGAGKSTLMQVLAGLTPPDSGRIEVGGDVRRFRSSREAAAAGIGMVHQHFTLVESFTVEENLALALPEKTPALLPRRGLASEPLQLAESLGWRLEPRAEVWQLPVGAQQRLEVVKVLARNPDVLIFDEPTAVLAPIEVTELFHVLRRLRAEGKTVVFISHKLNEVLELADRITVLRRGRNAGTLPAKETNADDLARRMVGEGEGRSGVQAFGRSGQALSGLFPSADQSDPTDPSDQTDPSEEPVYVVGAPAKEPMLRLRELHVLDDRGLEAVRDVSLEVRAGEILGIAGVDGNGQTELVEAVIGLRPFCGGAMEFPGIPREDEALPRWGIGYVPPDRRRSGLVPGMSVAENLVLELHQDTASHRGAWLRWGFLRSAAAAMMEKYDVRARSPEQPVETLSGGNQQKVVVARALEKQPRLLVAQNPTRGVDVASTAAIHEHLRQQRERGAAVLLVSTELDEVLALADRVAVLFEGRVAGIVPPGTDRETVGRMMGGRTPESDAPA